MGSQYVRFLGILARLNVSMPWQALTLKSNVVLWEWMRINFHKLSVN